MTRASGAARIFAYNWPIYVATWLGAAIAFALGNAFAAQLPLIAHQATMFAAAIAVSWSLASLAVSFYIYDRSELSGGTWIAALLPEPCRKWAMVHAGLDAEIELHRVVAGECLACLDIFDARFMTAPSIARARQRTPASMPATTCSPTALALGDNACDAVIVAFTAHEIRDRAARESFFGELRRILRVGGRVLVVEHLRDLANFGAFGPGFLHFVARAEWLRLASHAGFAISSERRVTPWVMALSLEKAS